MYIFPASIIKIYSHTSCQTCLLINYYVKYIYVITHKQTYMYVCKQIDYYLSELNAYLSQKLDSMLICGIYILESCTIDTNVLSLRIS